MASGNQIPVQQQIERNALEIADLHARIHRTFEHRDESVEKRQEWERACEAFHCRYDALAFPGGASTAGARVLAGDADAIEAAVCFVELRPYFFRSGYLYKELLRTLRRAPLGAEHARRYRAVKAAYDAYRQARRESAGRGECGRP